MWKIYRGRKGRNMAGEKKFFKVQTMFFKFTYFYITKIRNLWVFPAVHEAPIIITGRRQLTGHGVQLARDARQQQT